MNIWLRVNRKFRRYWIVMNKPIVQWPSYQFDMHFLSRHQDNICPGLGSTYRNEAYPQTLWVAHVRFFYILPWRVKDFNTCCWQGVMLGGRVANLKQLVKMLADSCWWKVERGYENTYDGLALFLDKFLACWNIYIEHDIRTESGLYVIFIWNK